VVGGEHGRCYVGNTHEHGAHAYHEIAKTEAKHQYVVILVPEFLSASDGGHDHGVGGGDQGHGDHHAHEHGHGRVLHGVLVVLATGGIVDIGGYV
jgi:hypothetical protein